MKGADETRKHIDRVFFHLYQIVVALKDRAMSHDRSKLGEPEAAYFEAVSGDLKKLTYGSPEYYANLVKIQPALDHHYAANPHHPEFHANGVAGMTLVDLVEMFCDWKAASERHADGDLGKSIEINTARYKLDPQLVQIFKNTKEEMKW